MIAWLDKTLYPGVEKNWDDHLFREHILKHLRSTDEILDVGAGAGIVAAMNFRGRAARVFGIDPDPRVAENPYLDEGKEGLGEHIPYPDGHFDLAFADNVLEHLPDPIKVFSEVARVLKPGGVFLAKTPNKWHYMPMIARCTPHKFHQFVNRLRGRAEVDTFPTRYLANSAADLAAIAARSGLIVENLEFIESRPEYLRMTPLTYVIGWLYERWVNLVPGFKHFRILLVATLRKPADVPVQMPGEDLPADGKPR